MTRSKAGSAVAVAVVAGALAVAGAGVAKTHPPTTLKLKADATGKLKFNKTTLSARTGKVTLVMKNPASSGQSHGIALKGHGLDKDGAIVMAGKTSKITVTLTKPGHYSFYCPVLGHRAAGMNGTLTVK
ncbi:MAG: hypothetical protein QOF55_494 [Thermoleophilaceae bacterium]|jgi:uncharacterized cupredoxin-like copper-binding protein|nr:hypothetical protein [Thermoleophilaceae bacterium]